jgi:hypothetical protein
MLVSVPQALFVENIQAASSTNNPELHPVFWRKPLKIKHLA